MAGFYKQNPAIFLEMNGHTLESFIMGQQKRMKIEFEQEDYLNFMSGYYQMTAYHNPKKYPSKPLSAQQVQEKKELSIEQQIFALKLWSNMVQAKEVVFDE